MNNKKIKILIVEDENITALDIKKNLEKNDAVSAVTASNGVDAVMIAEKERPNLILMDIMLKGQLNGIDVADIISRKFNIPIIYLTAYTDDETFLNAQMTNPFAFIGKPFNQKELMETIDDALHNYKAEIFEGDLK